LLAKNGQSIAIFFFFISSSIIIIVYHTPTGTATTALPADEDGHDRHENTGRSRATRRCFPAAELHSRWWCSYYGSSSLLSSSK
jgi:hypothetical protein